MPQNIPTPGEQHPDEWRQDLNPDAMAGQNQGHASPQPGLGAPTAAELKQIHRRYSDLTDDLLDQLSIVQPGTRLQQGAVYFDLRRPEIGEFKAMGNESVGEGDWIVAKRLVDFNLWNYLIGIENPERLGTGTND